MFRRRRPILGAAIVGGAAYQAGKRRGADEEYQQAEEMEAGPAPGELTDEALAQLGKLGQLHEAGVLTDEEFAEQKRKLLDG
jgi:hypothetical protein